MKISVLVSILASAAEAKKDKYFYCQTCAALVEESFFKVSQVGKLSQLLVSRPISPLFQTVRKRSTPVHQELIQMGK